MGSESKIEQLEFTPQVGWSIVEETTQPEQKKSGLIIHNNANSHFKEFRVVVSNCNEDSKTVKLKGGDHIYIDKNYVKKIEIEGVRFLICENQHVVLVKEIIL